MARSGVRLLLLRLLIEDRPRVVPKAELMQRMWPDSFVEEANLPVLIGEARAAIGDAGVGQIIRTHHRVGYGFAADVREVPSSHDRPRRAEVQPFDDTATRSLAGPRPSRR